VTHKSSVPVCSVGAVDRRRELKQFSLVTILLPGITSCVAQSLVLEVKNLLDKLGNSRADFEANIRGKTFF
jgi:hypothetical protein